ncbi:S-adenosyl-L-methionine-dependent methyltransferase [Exophiala viscosa]|uniref:S-adenosyl-L-methionine-dependent methyltransferase n=1 Tax=Exophiala viscosa TaxID=2486360 RepID=UPI00219C9ABF|nr:S-adenosyl-L-methionine-dependent methyltransferase [Exophiala viscosa]
MAPDRGSETTAEAATVEAALGSLSLQESQSALAQVVDSSDPVASTPPHLSHDPATNAKRTDPFQFGQRHLSESDDVFEYNAWDHVLPDSAHYDFCESQYAAQRAAPVSDFDRDRFNEHPEKWWDLFYKQKTSTFFKDRKWLVQEFPVLQEITKKDAGSKVVLEVGAGAGNTAFPILRMNENPELRIFAVDFSKKAVETMRSAEDYTNGNGVMSAEVWDAAGDSLPPGVEEGSVDIVIMIFIFSALNPKQWQQAVTNINRILKPKGEVLFRDYGRGDLAQVRFKAGRWMEDNFYVRGDGTRVYFFEKEQLEEIWGGSFDFLNLDVDRRLIVNRQRRIKMYRCWIQGRFQKKAPGTLPE